MVRPNSQFAVKQDTRTNDYRSSEDALYGMLHEVSIPESELCENLALFTTPQHLRRMLFLYEMYKKCLTVPGVIMQFGVRWGRELALFDSLRTAFEPFNHSRRIIGFDTFEGYVGIDDKDGSSMMLKKGNLATSAGYEAELDHLLRTREQLSPLPHVKKFVLVKGDCEVTFPAYLEENPHTIVSMAHFDLNLYRPTRTSLELIKPHLTKGSIVIIDEVNLKTFPGETLALREVFNLNEIRLQRDPGINPTWPAYFIVE